jgi:hypothetical protein
MKHKLFNSLLTLGFVSVVAFSLNGCKKNDGIVIAPEAALFANAATEGAYYVPDNSTTVFKIPVGLTAARDKDVTIQFTVTSPSGAAEGQQYTLASKSITIPAGKTVDSIPLKGIFNGFAGGRKDTLIFKITAGSIPVVSGSGQYTLVMQQFCPLVMSEFAGDFEVLEDGWEDYPPGTIIPLTVSGNKVLFYYNVAPDANMKPIEIIVDPATFKTSVLPQTYGDYGSSLIFSAKSVESSDNVAVPCDKKITVVLNHTSSAGNYGNYKISLQKK